MAHNWDRDLADEYEKLKIYHDHLMVRSKEIRMYMKEILDEMKENTKGKY